MKKLAGMPVVVSPKMPKGIAAVIGPSKDGTVRGAIHALIRL